jgi:hypothetical protein
MGISIEFGALHLSERLVTRLWDAGGTIESISRETGLPIKRVREILWMMAGGRDEAADKGFKDIREGSVALLDRIRIVHGPVAHA